MNRKDYYLLCLGLTHSREIASILRYILDEAAWRNHLRKLNYSSNIKVIIYYLFFLFRAFFILIGVLGFWGAYVT
jgi:hypothetical protein